MLSDIGILGNHLNLSRPHPSPPRLKICQKVGIFLLFLKVQTPPIWLVIFTLNGIIKNTKTNLTLYRRTHQSYIHVPKRPAKEDTEEEHLSKKKESEVYAPGLRLKDGPTRSRSPPARQGQEVDTDMNKAVEGRAAKASNTPLTDYQQISYQ